MTVVRTTGRRSGRRNIRHSSESCRTISPRPRLGVGPRPLLGPSMPATCRRSLWRTASDVSRPRMRSRTGNACWPVRCSSHQRIPTDSMWHRNCRSGDCRFRAQSSAARTIPGSSWSVPARLPQTGRADSSAVSMPVTSTPNRGTVRGPQVWHCCATSPSVPQPRERCMDVRMPACVGTPDRP